MIPAPRPQPHDPRSGDGLTAGGEFTADQGEGALYNRHAHLAGHLPQQLPCRNGANASPHKVYLPDAVLVEKGADVVESLGHGHSLAGVQT
jgi:hypothetical protein